MKREQHAVQDLFNKQLGRSTTDYPTRHVIFNDKSPRVNNKLTANNLLVTPSGNILEGYEFMRNKCFLVWYLEASKMTKERGTGTKHKMA